MKRLFCVLFTLLFVSLPAAAAPRLVLVPLKPNVYVAEDYFYAKENALVYIGSDHVTVIGATWTPETARLLLAEIKKVTAKPVTEVINQNHDLDRTGGNAAFQKIGAKIIAIPATRDLLAKEGKGQIADTRKFAPDYPDVPIVLPDTIVGTDFTLQNGAIRGFWLGPSHKPDDIFVWLTNEKILYGGCILKPSLGNTDGADLVEYPKTLQKLKAMNLPIATIVAGHGSAVHGPDLIDKFLGFLASAQPFSLAPNLYDPAHPDDLGLKPVPGTETYTAFKAGEKTDRYVNGVVLYGFRDKLYAQWQSSAKDEDSPDTHVMYAESKDGKHWSAPKPLSGAGQVMTTSGGWWSKGGVLIAYINAWNGDFRTGGRTLFSAQADGRHWSVPRPVTGADGKPVEGVIEQDPRALPDGRIITAFHMQPGLKAAPFFTDDPTGVSGWIRGALSNLPYQGNESRELEPSWFARADGCLTMVFRDQADTFHTLAAESCDRGATWSAPVLTGLPDARMKQSAGNLPDGTAFLVHAPSGNKLRSPLVLSLAKDGKTFDRAFLLRAGPPAVPRYPGLYKRPGYHYPKSVVWHGALWAGYADGKESVVVTRVPLAGLR